MLHLVHVNKAQIHPQISSTEKNGHFLLYSSHLN